MFNSKFKRDWHLIHKFTQANLQVNAQYRLGGMLWILNGIVTPLILMAVWLVMGQTQNLPLSNHQIVSYFFLSIIVVRLTQTWAAEDLTYAIKEGRFSIYLVKPYSFVLERLAKDQAMRLMRLVTLLPFMGLMTLLLYANLNFALTPIRIILFTFILILGYLINFNLEILVGITTFWLEDSYGAFLLLNLIRDLLAGILIPFALMPHWLKNWAIYSPFYIQVGLPIDVITGNLALNQALSFTLIALMWALFIILLSAKLYTKLIKNYTAVGI